MARLASILLLMMVSFFSNSTEISQNQDASDDLLEKGQAIYEKRCITCHLDGIANAPKFRFKPDWEIRVAEKNLDELIVSAIKGLNAMPVKGACWECTKDDLKAAILYMLPPQ